MQWKWVHWTAVEHGVCSCGWKYNFINIFYLAVFLNLIENKYLKESIKKNSTNESKLLCNAVFLKVDSKSITK